MRAMKCNLELRLLPSHMEDQEEEFSSRTSHGDHEQQQQLTILYNGRVCVSDVTELQARAILSLAAREVEETRKTPTSSSTVPVSSSSQLSTTPSNLSMNRSLQRFLQKRKNRIQSKSPYTVN
ncbi:putative Jasmonate-zim-domain protein 8 [Tripterygium wilfordii]|uniref:Protein TIFY n=1 Tax=Tripterygium wilfordii TaxID=458696 RepID=A0A7J7CQQ8_TRIWF|nr:protein TIFY 5A-like [Tripterygium wilfordii]KAF5736338.1 putative Jasmonate-zim-domain protein 8 [Tripterygium wilfordii]